MTTADVIDQVVATTVQALSDGTLSTFTPTDQIASILGLDSFKDATTDIPAQG